MVVQPAAAEGSAPSVLVQPDAKQDDEPGSDASDSDYVSEAESESECGSDSSLSNTQELQEDEEEGFTAPPLSRSASLAKQITLETFITDIIRDKGWNAATNWRDRELENVIQIAAIEKGIKTTATLLKKMIKTRAMEAADAIDESL